MPQDSHPFFSPPARVHSEGPFSANEVQLANRNPGTLLESLRHDLTPIGLHYLLIHFDVPFVAAEADWNLNVGGMVDTSLNLSLDDLRKLPERSLTVTLECAGNGRAGITPRSQSQPWNHEGVGTAKWTGTPLKGILEQAGLSDAASTIVFYGKDRGFARGIEHDYGRSLTPAQALHDDVLLVWAMNDQPLLAQHGFPLRLIVPGWYGMASVKWLDRIEVTDQPFEGYQQVGTYVYRKNRDQPGEAITSILVRSLMVPPGLPDVYTRARLLDAGPQTLFGRAWSGGGVPIERVEVAVDGEWRDATLDPVLGKYAWRGWHCEWQAITGERELMCRATDANGVVQPMQADFDYGGFGNNSVQRVAVTVR